MLSAHCVDLTQEGVKIIFDDLKFDLKSGIMLLFGDFPVYYTKVVA